MVIAQYSNLKINPKSPPSDLGPSDAACFNFAISRYLKKLGHSYLVVNQETPYLGQGRFAHYYQIMNKLGRLKFFDEPIKVDLVFNRSANLEHKHLPIVINSAKLSKIADSKIGQLKLFGDMTPETFVAYSHQQAIDYLRSNQDRLLVVKPDKGLNGRGIQFIRQQSELIVDDQDYSPPFLIQEFVESKLGVPNLVSGRHDLRVYMLNDGPICMAIRRPPKGSFLSNTSQGGSIEFYPARAIPPAVLKMADRVDRLLTKTGPRYYSSDFMRDQSGRWWLIEINSRAKIPFASQANPYVSTAQKRLGFFLLRSAYYKHSLDGRLYQAFKQVRAGRRPLRSSKNSDRSEQAVASKDLARHRHALATFKQSLPSLSRKLPAEIAATLEAIYEDIANNNLLRLKLLAASQTSTNSLQPQLFQVANRALYGHLDRGLWQKSINTLLLKHPQATKWRQHLHIKDKTTISQKLPAEHVIKLMVKYLELDKLAAQMKSKRFRESSRLEVLQHALVSTCQLPGWRVVTRANQPSASIAYAERRIVVPAQIESYSKRRIRKMAFHEIGVHLQRHMHTRLSPIRAFRLGLVGYEPFEEAVAVILAGYMTKQRQAKGFILYAGLGLALGLDGQPRNHDQTQAILEQLIGLNHSSSYAKKQSRVVAKRVFRGTDHKTAGAVFLSDKKYLEGLEIALPLLNACSSQAEVVKLLRYRYNPLDDNQSRLVNWLEANRQPI